MGKNPLARDLDHILAHTAGLFEEIRGGRLFITGGTGFFGCWLLETLLWANQELGLDVTCLLLTRDPDGFRKRAPHLAANPAVQLHAGDVRNYEFPKETFTHIFHGATTSAVATFNNEDALAKFDTVAHGTRHTLDFAVKCGCKKVLLTSSGSVYGKQPPDLTHIGEDYAGAPGLFDAKTALGEGKRAAEFFCAYYAQRHGLDIKIARCFSFVGPYLQLDIHYAIGNFIRDAMGGGPIRIHGDGTPQRSFLYAADLMIWLWTMLFRGESCRPYNVGSEEAYSIRSAAHVVAASFDGGMEVQLAKQPTPPVGADRYVPSTQRAQSELGLRETIDLADAVQRTRDFLGRTGYAR